MSFIGKTALEQAKEVEKMAKSLIAKSNPNKKHVAATSLLMESLNRKLKAKLDEYVRVGRAFVAAQKTKKLAEAAKLKKALDKYQQEYGRLDDFVNWYRNFAVTLKQLNEKLDSI